MPQKDGNKEKPYNNSCVMLYGETCDTNGAPWLDLADGNRNEKKHTYAYGGTADEKFLLIGMYCDFL